MRRAVEVGFIIIIATLTLLGAIGLLSASRLIEISWLPTLASSSDVLDGNEARRQIQEIAAKLARLEQTNTELSKQLQARTSDYENDASLIRAEAEGLRRESDSLKHAANQAVEDIKAAVASSREATDAGRAAAKESIESVKAEAENVRQAAEDGRKAAAESLNSVKEEAQKVREEAAKSIEDARKESEKIRQAAEESLKSLTLFRSFRDELPVAKEIYRNEVAHTREELFEALNSKRDVVERLIVLYSDEQDGIFKRGGGEHQRREALRIHIGRIIQEQLGQALARYQSRMKEADRNLYESLFLTNRFSGTRTPADYWMNPIATDIAGRSNLLNYLTDRGTHSLRVLEEAFTFIPIAGDIYDIGRLAYDPRVELVIRPHVTALISDFISGVSTSTDRVALKSTDLVATLANPLSLHTPQTLYAEYSLKNQE